jgi:hypothetical protein
MRTLCGTRSFSLEKEQRNKSAKFKRGDLVAEAAALALWPLSQLGWDDAGDTGKEIVGVAAHKKVWARKDDDGIHAERLHIRRVRQRNRRSRL